jgi:hypothetical protein
VVYGLWLGRLKGEEFYGFYRIINYKLKIKMVHGYAILILKFYMLPRGLKPTAKIFESGLRPWRLKIYNVLFLLA